MAEDTGQRGRWFVLPALGVLAAIFTAFWAPIAESKTALCTDYQIIPDMLCPIETQELASTDAEEFIDRFIGRSSASTPENGRVLLSLEEQTSWPQERFLGDWGPIAWAERVEPLEKVEGLNRYRISYRVYAQEANKNESQYGWTELRSQEASLQMTELGVLEVADLDIRRTVETRSTLQYPKITMSPESPGFERPRTDATFTMPISGPVVVLCGIRPSVGGTYDWVRTALGWYRMADAVDTSELRQTPPIECDQHHYSAP